jgi:transposase
MNRGDLTNAQWERLQPLLPPQEPHTGQPARDHRRMVNGLLWLLRTGAPWRDLPESYGPGSTVASRFSRWHKAGIWERLCATVQTQADADGKIDWGVPYVDGTTVRASQHAAGAKKGTRRSRREGGAGVGSAPQCMCARKVVAGSSPSPRHRASETTPAY